MSATLIHSMNDYIELSTALPLVKIQVGLGWASPSLAESDLHWARVGQWFCPMGITWAFFWPTCQTAGHGPICTKIPILAQHTLHEGVHEFCKWAGLDLTFRPMG